MECADTELMNCSSSASEIAIPLKTPIAFLIILFFIAHPSSAQVVTKPSVAYEATGTPTGRSKALPTWTRPDHAPPVPGSSSAQSRPFVHARWRQPLWHLDWPARLHFGSSPPGSPCEYHFG